MKVRITISDRMGHELETHLLEANSISNLQSQQSELYARVKSQRNPTTIYFFADWNYDNPQDVKPSDGVKRFNPPRVTSQKGYKARGLVRIL